MVLIIPASQGKSRAFESFCLWLRYRSHTPLWYKPFQVCFAECAMPNSPAPVFWVKRSRGNVL